MDNSSLEVRRQQDLEIALLEADNIIMKKYMNGISKNEIKEIEGYAFEDCNSIVKVENNSTVVGSYMFAECDNIKYVKLADNTTTINEHAFY